MAMPEGAKSIGLVNTGWFSKKYTDEELIQRNRTQQKVYYERHKKKTIHHNWIRQINKLGCSVELYEQLNETQKGLCAICGQKDKKKLSVDHCHKTGKVRGLLCNRCNRSLGMAEDNPELLYLMGDYLCQAAK